MPRSAMPRYYGADSHQPNRFACRLERLFENVLLPVIALWMLICTIATARLVYSVQLEPSDLRDASWISYTNQTLVSGNPLAYAMDFVLMFIAMSCCTMKNNWQVASIILLTSILCIFTSAEETTFRLALANNTAKIGCWNYTSKECLDMLRLPSDGAPSMYEQGKPANWYVDATKHGMQFEALDLLPVVPFLTSPSRLIDVHAVNLKLAQQRAEVAQFRKSFHVDVAQR